LTGAQLQSVQQKQPARAQSVRGKAVPVCAALLPATPGCHHAGRAESERALVVETGRHAVV